uniref:Tyrosinase copper-binding domain-containing protein n=1 Tax=Tetradesmus obliquus TaxID=3088 RepID=A0A383V433_TETOB|eukprot:jgi/Sobl393_1/13642/SZX60358.1
MSSLAAVRVTLVTLLAAAAWQQAWGTALPSSTSRQLAGAGDEVGIATMTTTPTVGPINGAAVSNWVYNSIPRRRDIFEINNLPVTDRYRTLYLLAMQEMQSTTDVTGPVYNHDAIAKIHGQSTPYQGACNSACANFHADCAGGTFRCSATAGYCPHSHPLFAAWHRPYLSQFEMALVNAAHAVAMRVADPGERSLYQQLAHQIRTPYINPLSSYITDIAFTILDSPNVNVIDPLTNASTSIPNPLASWGSPATTRSGSWKANFAANAVSWSSQITSFIASPDWGCTWGAGSCSSGATRLENTHGSMHVNIGGTMSSVPTAAKDPIFMMLHGYIDRVLQSWQGSGGSSPAVWMAPAVNSAAATLFYPAGTSISASSLLAPFYTSGWGGYWMDGSFARIQHANPWIALPYRYWTKWWWIIGVAIKDVTVSATTMSRLVAKELTDELADVHKGYRLQVWLDTININAIPNQGFCLHFISDYRGTTGKAFADQYAGRNGTVLVEKMQSEPQYCGNWCILGSSLERGKPLSVDASADITGCIVKQQQSLESTGPNKEPYLAPKSPYKLSNIYILPTSITRNGVATNFTRRVSLGPRIELRWSNFPLGKASGDVQTVQTSEESIRSGLPTRFIAESKEDEITLPGYAQGVLEAAAPGGTRN